MKKRRIDVNKSRRNKGFSLLEIGAALVVVGLMSAAISVMIADYGVQRKAKTAADKLAVVHEAANGYIKANYSALMADTTGNRKVVITSGRKSINEQPPVDSLQRKGFLPASFIDTNSYGQQHSLIVRQVSPTNGDPYLEAIVTTHGGQEIPDDQLGRVSGYVGVSGGYYGGPDISASDANKIVGNFGGWRSDVSEWSGGGVAITPGHVQSTLAFENGNLLTDYLYRNEVPGVPEANRMNTSIDMNRNHIQNIDTLTGVAKPGKGNIVTIDGNFEAVDVWAANVNADNVTVENDLTVKNEGLFEKNVDIKGNLNLPGKADDNGATGNLSAKKAIIGEIDLSEAFLTLPGKYDPSKPGSDSRFQERAVNNRIKLRDLLPRTVALYSYQVSDTSNAVPKPLCGVGEPKIMVYRQVESYNGEVVSGKTAISSGVYADSSNSLYWNVRWEGTASDPGIPRTAIAQTFCSYR